MLEVISLEVVVESVRRTEDTAEPCDDLRDLPQVMYTVSLDTNYLPHSIALDAVYANSSLSSAYTVAEAG